MEYFPEMQSTWQLPFQILESRWGVRRLAFCFTTKTLAAVSSQGIITLWNSLTGQCIQTLEGQPESIRGVAFSGDGAILASVANKGVQLWDTEAGTLISTLDDTHDFNTIAFTSDGEKLLTVTFSFLLCVRDLKNITDSKIIDGLQGVNGGAVTLSANAQTIAVCSSHIIKTWDITETRCSRKSTIDCIEVPNAVALSDDGQIVSSANYDIRIFDTATGELLLHIEEYGLQVNSLAFSTDKKVLASGSGFKISLWDLNTGHRIQILNDHRQQVTALAFLGTSNVLVSGSTDCTMRLWHIGPVRALETPGRVDPQIRTMSFSEDGNILAVAYKDGMIELWNAKSGRLSRTLVGHNGEVTCLAFINEKLLLASASADETIRLWDPLTSECLRVLTGHEHSIEQINLSVDQKVMASIALDMTIRLWDMIEYRCLHILHSHKDYIQRTTFSYDGAILASSSRDTVILLWDTRTGSCIHRLTGHTDWVTSLAFSPDGQILASAGYDQTIRIWDLETKRCLMTWSSHERVKDLAFSGNGRVLASISGVNATFYEYDGLHQLVVGVLESIALSHDGHYMDCERGTLAIEVYGEHRPEDPERLGSTVFVETRWILRGGQRFFLLPPQYQFPAHVAVRGRSVALGYNMGQVIVMRFK